MSSDRNSSGKDENKGINRRKVLGGSFLGISLIGTGMMASDVLKKEPEEPAYLQNETEPGNSSDSPFAEGRGNDSTGGSENDFQESTGNQQPGNEEELPSPVDYTVSDPSNYNWQSEDELMQETGFCYAGAGNEGYLGALDGAEVGAVLSEDHFSGEDPNGALNDGEFIGNLDDLDSVDGKYAVDVDLRSGDEEQLYVQLVGEQNGGLYVNRQGAYQLSELEWEEEWNDCSS